MVDLDSPELSVLARRRIANGNNQLYWSAASSWEVAIKYQLGKLSLPRGPAKYIPDQLKMNSILSLPILDEHCFEAGRLPQHHRDPFDCILIAQARVEKMAILSQDPEISRYEVKVIW